MEYDWVERGRMMLWVGLIGGLIVGVLGMYGAWLLVRSLDGADHEKKCDPRRGDTNETQ